MTALDILRQLVAIPSVYPHEHSISDFLQDYLTALGAKVETMPIATSYCSWDDQERLSVLATLWPVDATESLLLYAHMDTVPLHDVSLRDTDPFVLTQWNDPDRYYGLGAVDMKWWLAMILSVLSDIDQEQLRASNKNIKIVIGVDEELWSKGAHTVVTHPGFFDSVVCCLVPEVGTIVGETDSSQQNLVLWRRGRMLVEVTVHGKSAHAAIAAEWHGINALTEIAKLLIWFDRYQLRRQAGKLPPWNQLVRSCAWSVSSLSVPEVASLVLDIHTIVGETPETILESIARQIDEIYDAGDFQIQRDNIECKIKQRPTPTPLAYEIAVDHPWVQKIARLIQQQTGNDPRLAYGYSVADENVLQAWFSHFPVLTMWPVGDNEHAANERISHASLVRLGWIYAWVVRDFIA